MEKGLPATATGRVASLDALRGFDMFWIIGGDAICRSLPAITDAPWARFLAGQVEHKPWAGFTFYDLIFPLFLFIIGAVFPFSLLKRAEKGESRSNICLHVVKRSLILILLGLIAGGILRFDFANMRWTGVLQRIGICYLLVALLVLNTKVKTQVAVFVGILLLYWAVLAFIPVPGHGAGLMTPEGSLHSYIDQKVLPGKISEEFYGPGDSLGVLSTLTAACSLLLGVFAGYWLKSNRSGRSKTLGLAAAGVVCLAVGYVWGLAFPIIKHIWTSTYVLWGGGWSLLLMALFYWIIDVKGWSRWAFFFVVIGTNAILVYFGQQVVDFDGIARFFLIGVERFAGTWAPLIIPLGALALKWAGLLFLHRRRIYFRV
ncbi:MAG: acyltransferase family protein [Candidatus Aminicenantales bacterium]